MATALLIAALLLPIVVFWLLKSRSRLSNLAVVVIAVTAGWALNLAWAFVSHESLAIAGALGWVCPIALVLVTWLVWRFAKRRAEP